MTEKPIDSMNVLPFVDIMLVLLTIVLTTSSFIASGRIPVKLPQATSSHSDTSQKQTIVIDAAGVIHYGAETVNAQELKARLAAMDKQTAFLLRADRTVQLQRFIAVADVLKQLGFAKVAVQTEVATR